VGAQFPDVFKPTEWAKRTTTPTPACLPPRVAFDARIPGESPLETRVLRHNSCEQAVTGRVLLFVGAALGLAGLVSASVQSGVSGALLGAAGLLFVLAGRLDVASQFAPKIGSISGST
jgi:hypothetical protein